jgi:hypothetical protein
MAVDLKTVPTTEKAETARAASNLPNRESTKASRDFRNTSPHVFLDETYNASGGYSGRIGNGDYTYIVPNPTENFFKTRVRMSVYLNDFKQFINAKFEPIFKEAVKTYVQTESGVDIPNHVYLDFVGNVTGSGVNKNEFMKAAIRQAYIHDVSFVVMDKMAGALLPYLYLKTINDVLGYSVDVYGGLASIYFDDGCKKHGDEVLYFRRYIGTDRWALQKSKDKKTWVEVSATPNNMRVLPVYPLWTHRGSDLTDYSTFEPSNYGIAAVCAWLYDKGSKLDYVIDKQAHAILVLQGDMMSVPSGTDNALVISPSEHSVFQPSYISPDSSLPGVHQARINSVENKLIRMMTDGGVNVSMDSAPESGVARGYKFWATNTTLKATVALLSEADKWIFETYRRFTGDTASWLAYSEYPTDFTPTTGLSVEQLVDLIEFYKAEGLPRNVVDAHKRLRSLIDPMATREDSQDLLDEIEERYDGLDAAPEVDSAPEDAAGVDMGGEEAKD